jgi:hypothetical protein
MIVVVVMLQDLVLLSKAPRLDLQGRIAGRTRRHMTGAPVCNILNNL